ncbi:MAG: ATP-binding protein [Chloroflexi bacterium]|nr:ATP-binding protein [Chloroflexota bacterium]
MLNEHTVTLLNSLKLFGMARGFAQRLADTGQADLSHAEFVALLVQDEKTYRDNNRLQRLLRNAKLRQQAALEDIDYRHPRGLNKQVILELADTQWIAAHRTVLISGPTGVGKSFIACALGNSAARAGYTVHYTRAPRLFESLQQAKGDGSHLKTLTRLGKAQLLIIDDFLLTPLAEAERKDLLEIVEERHGLGATVITSQCPIKDWHPNIGDPTLADSICDRLLHTAYRIELRGESMRKRQSAT